MFPLTTSPSSTFVTKHGYLLQLFPPIFVYILATMLFEFSLSTNVTKLPATILSHIASQDLNALSLKLIEMRARYIWFATIVVSLIVFLYAAV